MRNKKWWRILLPVLVAVNVVVVLMILGSARTDDSKVVIEKEVRFEAVKLPEQVSFAGEEMPLDRFDVKEALDRELLSNAYFHSQTIRYLKLAPRYLSIIEPILKEEGIPDDFKYLSLAESGFNPSAISPANAVGFWQFMKGTALDYGLEVNTEIDERYHVEKSTRAACQYLKDSYEIFGSWTLVAASYNRGMAGIRRQLERQKEDNYYDLLITTETARYVYRIVALKLLLEHPEKYNFYVSEDEKYPLIPTKEVEINGAVANFADFAKEQGINYKLLKDFNPWLRESTLVNSKKKKYVVEIPVL
jgi:hypothetical protein